MHLDNDVLKYLLSAAVSLCTLFLGLIYNIFKEEVKSFRAWRIATDSRINEVEKDVAVLKNQE